jgi:hypothetical protein
MLTDTNKEQLEKTLSPASEFCKTTENMSALNNILCLVTKRAKEEIIKKTRTV